MNSEVRRQPGQERTGQTWPLPRPGPPLAGLLGDPSPALVVGHSGPGRVTATLGTTSVYQGFLHCLSHKPHTWGNSLEGLHNQ